MEKFVLTQDHLKLINHLYVSSGEYAPTIDEKRPFGNSHPTYDVVEILGWPNSEDEEFPDEYWNKTDTLMRELETALQIVFCTMKFEIGTYIKTEPYNNRSWKRQ